MIFYLNSLYDAGSLFRSLPNIVSYRIFHQTSLRIMESGSNKESMEIFVAAAMIWSG